MTPNPSTLLAPVTTAFPKYSGVFNALATLIACDAPIVTPTPTPTSVSPTPIPTPFSPTPTPTFVSPIPTPTPAPPIPTPLTPPISPVTPLPGSILAGRYFMLGGAALSAFDFGDPASSYNVLRGYTAAHVYDKPGKYVITTTPAGQGPVKQDVTVVPDPRPQVTLAPGADLAAVLAGTKGSTIYLLPGGVTFDVKMPATISADGVTLRAAPAASPAGAGQAPAAPRIRRIAAPGVYSTLIVSGSDVSIEGIEFDSDQPHKPAGNVKVGIFAINIEGHNLLVRNC